ncbi:MAG TPA: FAD-dependent monooxygenase [Pseudonocardia sp.]|nr:FAD-dependent monooxygenase [Pseudonocardia sp.]
MSDGDVLVVGAGPTGLMAAGQLARWGARVRVVDAAAGPAGGSRGKGLQPRTLEILDGLGVSGRLLATGRFRLPIRRHAADGTHQDVDPHPGVEPTPDSPYARTMVIPQWRVEETLRELLTGHGVEVEWGTEVVGLAQSPEVVSVELADGSRLAASYVIGCDGGSSVIREQLGVSFLGETDEDVRMLLGDVMLDGLDRDHWHMFLGATGRMLALCPLPATDAFQFQAPLLPGDPVEPSLEAFQAVVDEAVGTGRVRLRGASWLSRWRLNVRMVDRYRVGRVFLAGDAAHVHSPAGGQGMNTGIQDAANLGWKLAHVLAGADPALLDSYEAERLPVAAGVLGLSSRLLRVPLGSRGEAGKETLQLGLSYRGGPLAPVAVGAGGVGAAAAGVVAGQAAGVVADQAAGRAAGVVAGQAEGLVAGQAAGQAEGPVAGDRAPDAPCVTVAGRPVRLFDLLRGPHWTLLGFDVRPEQPTGPVRVVGIGSDVLDNAGHAARAYGASAGELVLIRPDGYLGIRTSNATEVIAYLRGLGVDRLGALSTDALGTDSIGARA